GGGTGAAADNRGPTSGAGPRRGAPPMSAHPATSSQWMPSHLAGVETDKTVRRTLKDAILAALEKNPDIVTDRLLTMDNQIDPNTGTNRLKAVFENKVNALFPNQFVNIRLLVETRKDKVLIPARGDQAGATGNIRLWGEAGPARRGASRHRRRNGRGRRFD